MTEAAIYLRVPAETKGRWVRESRAEGLRLSEWITQKIEGDELTEDNPTPAQIREARKEAGLTQAQAAALVYSTDRSWRMWEAGDGAMSKALWELFCIKTRKSK